MLRHHKTETSMHRVVFLYFVFSPPLSCNTRHHTNQHKPPCQLTFATAGFQSQFTALPCMQQAQGLHPGTPPEILPSNHTPTGPTNRYSTTHSPQPGFARTMPLDTATPKCTHCIKLIPYGSAAHKCCNKIARGACQHTPAARPPHRTKPLKAKQFR